MLQYQTVSTTLLNVLKKWQGYEELADFRLVGGTALALLYGHRKSVDIDLFSASEIPDSLNILMAKNENINIIVNGKYHVAFSDSEIKVDFAFWNMVFEDFESLDGIKMASPLDIFAMKLDAITTRRTQKDYFDIAELLQNFSFKQGFERYNKHFPYSKNSQIIFEAIGGIDDADTSETPVMLKNQKWEEAKLFVKNEAKNFFLKGL
jgi:Nucleotidyl transferase AbiEii toxin, Type IV TA system